MKIFLIWVILYISLFVRSVVYPCEPCSETLNFEETAKRANLIIIGQKVGEGPTSDFIHQEEYKEYFSEFGVFEWIKLKIIRVLKGKTNDVQITVNSWDGFCEYGIIVDNKTYIIFLEKRESSDEDYQYDAVNLGCAVKTFLVEDNMVDFQGQKISIDDFAKKLEKVINRQER